MAADSLSRRERLEALRSQLEAALAGEVPHRELAALSREYRACLAELDALPAVKEVSAADEIAERRRARKAGANRKARTADQG